MQPNGPFVGFIGLSGLNELSIRIAGCMAKHATAGFIARAWRRSAPVPILSETFAYQRYVGRKETTGVSETVMR